MSFKFAKAIKIYIFMKDTFLNRKRKIERMSIY